MTFFHPPRTAIFSLRGDRRAASFFRTTLRFYEILKKQIGELNVAPNFAEIF